MHMRADRFLRRPRARPSPPPASPARLPLPPPLGRGTWRGRLHARSVTHVPYSPSSKTACTVPSVSAETFSPCLAGEIRAAVHAPSPSVGWNSSISPENGVSTAPAVGRVYTGAETVTAGVGSGTETGSSASAGVSSPLSGSSRRHGNILHGQVGNILRRRDDRRARLGERQFLHSTRRASRAPTHSLR